jgi:hypothetical protein
MLDLKLISPGFSQLPMNMCYPIKDRRDYVIQGLNQQITSPIILSEQRKISYSTEELQQHVLDSLNSRKIL